MHFTFVWPVFCARLRFGTQRYQSPMCGFKMVPSSVLYMPHKEMWLVFCTRLLWSESFHLVRKWLWSADSVYRHASLLLKIWVSLISLSLLCAQRGHSGWCLQLQQQLWCWRFLPHFICFDCPVLSSIKPHLFFFLQPRWEAPCLLSWFHTMEQPEKWPSLSHHLETSHASLAFGGLSTLLSWVVCLQFTHNAQVLLSPHNLTEFCLFPCSWPLLFWPEWDGLLCRISLIAGDVEHFSYFCCPIVFLLLRTFCTVACPSIDWVFFFGGF